MDDRLPNIECPDYLKEFVRFVDLTKRGLKDGSIVVSDKQYLLYVDLTFARLDVSTKNRTNDCSSDKLEVARDYTQH